MSIERKRKIKERTARIKCTEIVLGVFLVILISQVLFLSAFYRKQVVSDSYENLIKKGDASLKQKKYDEVIIIYLHAIALKKKEAIAYNKRGLAYQKKILFDFAQADFNKALELDPKSSFNYIDRAEAYYETGHFDTALADYNRTLKDKITLRSFTLKNKSGYKTIT